MVIYLYGPDSYRRQEKLKEIVAKFKEKHSALTVDVFHLGDDAELNRLKDFATAQSLFDSFKLGIISNAGEAESEDVNGILQVALDSKTLTLIVSAEAALPKEYKLLGQKQVLKQEFKKPSAAVFAGFVRDEAAQRNLKLSSGAIAALARHYQGDSWGVITELEKLSLGGKAEPFVEEENFFSLIGQLQNGRSPLARLATLEKLIGGKDPAMIFNFVASRSPSTRASPEASARRASSGQADAFKTKMADYDVAIKSGKLEYEEALISLVI